MPGDKRETPISGNMKNLLTSVRRGQTAEVRTETLLRGLLQQSHIAQKAGPVAFAEWEQNVTLAISECGAAIGGMIGSDAKSMQAHSSEGGSTK